MPRTAKARSTATTTVATVNLGVKAKLWLNADKVCHTMDAVEYEPMVIGLIFLKTISSSFAEQRSKLLDGVSDYEGTNSEIPDGFKVDRAFQVPIETCLRNIQASANQLTTGMNVDNAVMAFEPDNQRIKGVLPKENPRLALDKQLLGKLATCKDRIYNHCCGSYALVTMSNCYCSVSTKTENLLQTDSRSSRQALSNRAKSAIANTRIS
jgi:type I restriction-modification system DNA methylase subunit